MQKAWVLGVFLSLNLVFVGTSAASNQDSVPQEKCQIYLDGLYRSVLTGGSQANGFPTLARFNELLGRIEFPVAHGLTTDEFRQAAQTCALRPGKVREAWNKKALCLSDLNFAEAIPASLGFAYRNDFSSLAVESRRLTGLDLVDRFAQENPMFREAGWRKPILKTLLRAVAEKFTQDRPMGAHAYPVFLVFEGEGISFRRPRPDMVPSELETPEPIQFERLRAIFVPAQFVQPFAQEFRLAFPEGMVIYPLELFELVEAEEHHSQTRRVWDQVTSPLRNLLVRFLARGV